MMISIREYADSRGKSHQAIYKQMKTKKNAPLLEGHTLRKEGKLWLDEEAIRILDESCRQSPVVVLQDQEDEAVEDMKIKIDEMRDLIIDLQQRLIESHSTLADAQYKVGLLENAEVQADELKKENTKLIDEVARLKAELEAEKNRSWLSKLFNKTTHFVD